MFKKIDPNSTTVAVAKGVAALIVYSVVVSAIGYGVNKVVVKTLDKIVD